MKEETLIIKSREQLTNCLTKVESLLNSFINQVYIKLDVSKELFEECLSLVVPKLNFYQKGIITSLNVIDNSFHEYEEDDFPLVKTLDQKSIIKFKIPSEMTLKITSFAIFLGEVEGTLILENEETKVICKKLNNAKIINTKCSSYLTKENVFIKGDQIL